MSARGETVAQRLPQVMREAPSLTNGCGRSEPPAVPAACALRGFHHSATMRRVIAGLNDAVQLIREQWPDPIAIYLFGSVATGDARAQSDVDLAVLGRGRHDGVRRWHLQERLASVFHRAVDLVDLQAASTVLRVQVLEHGEIVFDGEPSARAAFEAMALGAYARLNEARAGILADVRERGSVYG